MSPMKRRLIEDRAMRDAARAVVNSQVAWFKAGAGEPGFAAHVLETGKDYATTVADGAIDFVQDNRSKLSGGAALAALALAAWLFRAQLGDLMTGIIDGLNGEPGEDAEADTEFQPDNQQET